MKRFTDINETYDPFHDFVLNKLRESDIDDHYGFNDIGNLQTRFYENYKLDDIKRVLGNRDYKRIKKELLRKCYEPDPIIEIKITFEQSATLKTNNYPDNTIVIFNRLSGKLQASCEKDDRLQWNNRFEIWENLTEDYFRELEYDISIIRMEGESHTLGAPTKKYEIKRLSGKKFFIASNAPNDKLKTTLIVNEIKNRIEKLMGGLYL